MKKLFFFLCFYALLLLRLSVPVSAGCCTGPGCNPASLPPYSCAPYHCDTQKDCDDKAPAPAPAAGAATPTCGADNSGTPTALGCIPNEPAAAIAKILPWAIRLGTGLAFLLFLYGAFTLITAGSDPQKVDTGKSIITSAAAGLIFIILSMLLLRVIGVDILEL